METHTNVVEEVENPQVQSDNLNSQGLGLDSAAQDQSKPEASLKSNQESSTEEIFDEDAMKEAEAGGSDILPASSTSKLSTSLGVPEEDFINMQSSDPMATLRLLLTKQAPPQSSSDKASDSTQSAEEINSTVRQDYLLLRLTTDFVMKDVPKLIKENPSAAFGHLNFLKKLHNPLTNDETLGKILQIESIIDQLAKAVQHEQDTATRLDAKKQAHDLLLERAKSAQAEVDRLAEEAKERNPQIKACDENISDWENHIIVLQSQINDYRRRIAEEEAKRSKLQEDANSSIKPLIDEKGREGLKAYSASAAIFEEVKSLENAHHVMDKEIGSLTKLYWEFVKHL
jgi:hypothetical protein